MDSQHFGDGPQVASFEFITQRCKCPQWCTRLKSLLLRRLRQKDSKFEASLAT